MKDEYYLQDKRTYVGNDVLWWAKDGRGYTTDLSNAHVYTKKDAVHRNHVRHTDIPWPKDYVDSKTRPAVDMQYIDSEIALKETGVELFTPPKPKPQKYKCCECGRFISKSDYYTNNCKYCDGIF